LSSTVLLASVNGGMWRSNGGENTWFEAGAEIATGLFDLEKLDRNTVVGVSGSGDIWRTAGGGSTGDWVWVGEGDLPCHGAANFVNLTFSTVGGVRHLMYRTHRGGLTWTRVNRGAAFDANGVAAVNNNTVVTLGHHGYVQRMNNNES
jgi:hypothetical protein